MTDRRADAIARHPSGRAQTSVPQLVLVPLLDIPPRDDARDRKESR